MSTLSRFGGGSRRVAEVFNATSPLSGMSGLPGARSYTLNATGTANQWQTVLSVSGAGRLNLAAVAQLVGSTTAQIRVTVDGVVITTRSAGVSVGSGAVAVGFPISNPSSGNVLGFSPQPIDFAQSLLIEASTSLASGGTPSATIFAAYEVNVA